MSAFPQSVPPRIRRIREGIPPTTAYGGTSVMTTTPAAYFVKDIENNHTRLMLLSLLNQASQ